MLKWFQRSLEAFQGQAGSFNRVQRFQGASERFLNISLDTIGKASELQRHPERRASWGFYGYGISGVSGGFKRLLGILWF